MSSRIAINSDKGLASPVFSQANVVNGLVFVSGNIGMNYKTMEVIPGPIEERARQALKNIQTVLEEAGSGLQNIVKANIYLTDMANYNAVNKVYMEMIHDPKPARTCVCVKELPFKTDVEIECIAHL